MPKEPSAREALFCEYYKILRSPREAAARAGYPFPEKAGIRLLSKERIKRELRPSNDAVEGLRRLAFGSVADAVRLCRGEIPDKELEKLDLFMVSELKFPKAGGVEVKFFDRIKALELLSEQEAAAAGDGAEPFYRALSQAAKNLRGASDED